MLGSASKRDDGKVTPTFKEAHLELDTLRSLPLDRRLGGCALRSPWPLRPRLEPRLLASRWEVLVDLVRRTNAQSGV